MWSIKKGIKQMLNLPEGQTEGLLFSVDDSPSLEIANRIAVKGWALDPKGAPVRLELKIDGERVTTFLCQSVRSDVHEVYPENPYSLLSGFDINFEMQLLARIQAGRLSLIAQSSWGEQLLWEWQREGEEGLQESYLATSDILQDLAEAREGQPDVDWDPFWLTADEVKAFYHHGSLQPEIEPFDLYRPENGHLAVHLVIESGGAGARLAALTSIIKDQLSVSEVVKIKSVTVIDYSDSAGQGLKGAFDASVTSLAPHASLYTTQEFPGWKSAFAETNAAGALVLTIQDDVDIKHVNLVKLLSDFTSYPSCYALSAAPYGDGSDLPLPQGYALESVSSRAEKLLYLLSQRGPVCVTALSFLQRTEPENGKGYFSIPEEDRFRYHLDLCQPCMPLSFYRFELSTDDEFLLSQILRHHFRASSAISAGAAPVLCVISEEGVSEEQRVVVSEIVSGLKSSGKSVAIVVDGEAAPGVLFSGIAPMSFEDCPSVPLPDAQIIACDVRALRAAYALSYVTGAPVARIAGSLERELLSESFPAQARLASWAKRSEAVSLEFVSDGEGVSFNPPVSLRSQHQHFGNVVLLNLSNRIIRPELLPAVRDVLKAIKSADRSAVVTIVGAEVLADAVLSDADRAVANELRALSGRQYCSLSRADRSELLGEAKIFLDLFPSYEFNSFAHEALAHSVVPVIAHHSGEISCAVKEAGCVISESPSDWAKDVATVVSEDESFKQRQQKAKKVAESIPNSLDGAALLQQIESARKNIESSRDNSRRKVTIILPVYNALASVQMCVRSVMRYLPPGWEVVVVNDASDAGTALFLNSLEQIRGFQVVHQLENKGFIGACRAGFEASDLENDIVLLNSDVVLTKDALMRLQEAAYSSPRVGAASPLSTGSPHFEIALNDGDSLEGAAAVISESYEPKHPTVITPEGQCLYLRRDKLDRFGFFDPVYGRGFCEESDLCMRWLLHGVDTVLADDALIYHERAASFAKEAKNEHLIQNRPIFNARWGRYYGKMYTHFRSDDVMEEVRRTYGMRAPRLKRPVGVFTLEAQFENYGNMEQQRHAGVHQVRVLNDAEVVFILPSIIPGGGTLSVLQHVNEMILRGVKARVISLQPPQLGDYPLLTAPIVVAPEEIFSLDWSDQHIVATYWFTSYMVKSLTLRYPEVSGYYYVQDYEPWFYPRPERFKTVQQVEKSYEQGLTCVAKTEYLKDLLKSRHGVDVSLVTPGLYRGAFYPGLQNEYQGPPRLAALFRQRTPRRGGEELLSVLKIVKEQLPELQVTLFGDTEGLPEELAAQVNLVGVLSQNKVGALYRDTDIVVDLSHWHGFGRMGIEGMACGAVPVLTRSGGVERYASDNENSFLLEVGDIAGTAKAIVRLATDKLLRIKMRQAGLESLIGISEMQATSDWLTVFGMSESQKNVADKGSTGAVQSAAK